jgi:hypothetical protein
MLFVHLARRVKKEVLPDMATSSSVSYSLPQGWTPRKVAQLMVKDWLPPFLAEADPRAPRWVLQSVMEPPENGTGPIWEAGISTEEYEERLENSDIAWAIRASVARGRTKGTVLARLHRGNGDPNTVELTIFQGPLPQTLFDNSKVEEYLTKHDATEGIAGLLTELLNEAGLRRREETQH